MRTFSNRDIIYIGKKAGESVLNSIKKARKSIKIISPYLTPSYIEELIRLRKKGINITLITSDNLEEGRGDYSNLKHTDLIKQERTTDQEAKKKREQGIKYSGISFLLPIIYFFIFQTLTAIVISFISIIISGIIFASFYNIRIYSYRYYSLFKLKVIYSQYSRERRGKYLVHSKVYVIDEDVAYVGSINYSYPSLIKNYECSVKIEDKMAISRISKEVDNLFHSGEIEFKSITEWGKMLYEELPH